MRKVNSISTILTIVLLLSSFASAQADSVTAGTAPDSALYQLDIMAEEVRIFFIFDPLKKADARLEQSDERLAEVNVMLEAKKDGLASAALARHDASLIKARDEFGRAKVRGEIEELDQTLKVEEKIRKRNEVLQSIIDRFKDDDNPNNDNALKGLQNALDQSKNFEGSVGEKVIQVKERSIERKVLNEDEAKLRVENIRKKGKSG